jgi:hypothetical protein
METDFQMRQNNSFNKTYIHWQMNLNRMNEKVCTNFHTGKLTQTAYDLSIIKKIYTLNLSVSDSQIHM